MADLGNLFFRLGIKDEEAQKVLDRIEQRLVSTGYKVKLQAPNANEFLKDLREQLKSQTLDVRAKVVSSSTTGAVTTPADLRYTRMLEVQQRMANATAVAQQRLANERNRDIRASERHAAAMLRNAKALKSSNDGIISQSKLLSDLRNQIFDVYSIYTIERFLTNVVEIGGEFQKQHIALKAMLGDAAKADVMFGKIKELAVESPFNFRELMGFTKQIAAFGIPYEEMYETTKRLADISAGLGVDMGRIILAYGQVRSAAFLRGQELRQFTEAGIPLVDELAKKFTELEGRVVSAGEVFEKISRREVSFGMVKDVLWELTNEGGRFYNMQEVLTESLSGKLAKLKDSWEIMLSNIAEGHNNILGGTLDTLTKITDEYKIIIGTIGTLVTAYGTYKASIITITACHKAMFAINAARRIATIAASIEGLGRAATAAKTAQLLLNQAVSKFGKVNVYAFAIAAIAAISYSLYQAYSNANKLHDELDGILSKANDSWRSSASDFGILVEKLKYAVKGTKEYNEVVEKIHSKYGDYIGHIEKEAYSYDVLKASIDSVTESLKAKNVEDAKQSGIASIKEDYGEDLKDKIDDFQNILIEKRGVSKGMARSIAMEFKSQYEDILRSGKSIQTDDLLNKILENKGLKGGVVTIKSKELIGGLKESTINTFDDLGLSASALGRVLDRMDKEIKDFNNSLYSISSTDYGKEIDAIKKKYEQLSESIPNDAVSRKRQNEIAMRNEMRNVYEKAGMYGEVKRIDSEIAMISKLRDEWRELSDEKFKSYSNLKVRDDEKSNDYISRLREEYKKYKDIIRTAVDESEVADAKKRMKSIESYFGHYKLPLVDPWKGRGEKDLTLEGIKERISLIKAAYSEYRKWANLIGDDKAKDVMKNSGLFSILGDEEIPTNLKEYKEKLKEIIADLNTAIAKESTKERRDALRNVLKQLLDAEYDITKDLYIAEYESMRDYLKKYGSFEQKKLAITEEYEDKIRKARTKGKRLQLEKEKAESLSRISYENVIGSIDWKALFSGVDSLGKDMAKPLIDKLEAFVNTPEYKTSDSQTQRDIAELIKELRNYIGTDENVTWETLAQSMKDFTVSVDTYNNALNAEKNAIKRRYEAKSRFERGEISEDEYKKFVEEADNLGFATAEAKKSMDNFASALNNTSDKVKNYVSKLSAVLNNANSWSGVDGFSNFKDSVKSIDSLIGNINSTLANMKDGAGKEFLSSISSSVQSGLTSTGNKLAGILSSGMGQVIGFVAQIPKLILNMASMIKGFVTGILDSFTELISLRWIDDLVNGILNSIGNLVDAIFDLPENLYKMLESVLVKGVGGFANSLLGRLGNILSFGFLSSNGPAEWFRNSNAEDVAERQNELIESNKLLSTSIDDLRDILSKTSGVKAIDTARQAKEYQERYNKNLLDIAWAQARYHNSHSSWSKEWKGFNQDQINRFSQKIGRDWNGDIFNLSPEEMKMLRGEVDMWKQIQDTGKGGYGHRLTEKLDAYIDQAGKLEETERQLAESLTQVSFDNLRNEFIDSLMDMDKSAQDFASDFEKYMMRAMLNAKVSDMLDDDIKAFYDAWSEYSKSDSKLTEAEIEKLRKRWQELVDKGLIIRDEVSNVTGYEGNGKESSSVSKGIAGVTEETADLLASYINAVRADVSVGRVMQEKFFNTDFPQLSAVAQAQLTQLNAIAANTSRNVELVGEIYSILSRNIKGVNKFHV